MQYFMDACTDLDLTPPGQHPVRTNADAELTTDAERIRTHSINWPNPRSGSRGPTAEL